MKTLLLSMVSPAYYPLAAVTTPSHEAYAKAQGYDCRCLPIKDSPDPYGGAEGEIARLRGVLAAFDEGYEQVVMHDMDVIFTNHTIRAEDIMAGALVVVAREHLRWWPINLGVVIWRKGESASRLLHRLIEDEKIWVKYKWTVQTHFWNLMQTDAETRAAVVLVPARVMNSTGQTGAPLSRWQLGDFVLHLLDMPLAERIETARAIIGLTGPQFDGTLLK